METHSSWMDVLWNAHRKPSTTTVFVGKEQFNCNNNKVILKNKPCLQQAMPQVWITVAVTSPNNYSSQEKSAWTMKLSDPAVGMCWEQFSCYLSYPDLSPGGREKWCYGSWDYLHEFITSKMAFSGWAGQFLGKGKNLIKTTVMCDWEWDRSFLAASLEQQPL